MRTATLAALFTAAAALGACGADATTTPAASTEDAAAAAQRFDHVADSVSAASGAEAAAPYRAMADVVRQAGAISPVTLRIGDEDVPFSAIGVATILTGSVPCPVPPVTIGSPDGKTPAFCPVGYPLSTRALLAWQPRNPARLVQLVATSEKSAVGYNPLAMTPVAFPFPATLTYADGAHGFWWATSGTQSNGMTLGGACTAATTTDRNATTKCTEAKFTFEFQAVVGPWPFPIRENRAAGTKALSMKSSTVNGVQLQITVQPPPPPPAPALKATLGAKVDGNVTLTFVVTNAADTAATITFPTSQQYDFWIVDKATARELWRWSAGKAFAQVVTTRKLAAHESLTYAETWTPPATAHGTIVAHAVLTARPIAGADVTATLP